MPRFFDDYSNTYLTHDSSAGRKQQRRGWKFRENFKLHYEKFVPEWRKGPMGLASAQQAFIQARGVNDPAVPPLPDGWKEDTDDVTGIQYYIDPTGRRTWVRPGFIPPPPGAMMGGPPPPSGQFNRGGFAGGPPPFAGGAAAPGLRPPPPPPPQGLGPPQQQQQQQQPSSLPPPPPVANLPPPPQGSQPPPSY